MRNSEGISVIPAGSRIVVVRGWAKDPAYRAPIACGARSTWRIAPLGVVALRLEGAAEKQRARDREPRPRRMEIWLGTTAIADLLRALPEKMREDVVRQANELPVDAVLADVPDGVAAEAIAVKAAIASTPAPATDPRQQTMFSDAAALDDSTVSR